MPGFVFCSLEGRCCEKVGVRGEIIEDKQGKTGVNFAFLPFWMRFCLVERYLRTNEILKSSNFKFFLSAGKVKFLLYKNIFVFCIEKKSQT